MTADPDATRSSSTTRTHGRRFKPRQVELADGGRLLLDAGGSITLLDASGAQVGAWSRADADWASHAIRFGLFPQDATVAPTGRHVEGFRPPRR
jgi:hypothetical protein